MVVVSNNFDAPVDGILLETPGTKLIINGQELGTATLYITQNNVVWGGGLTPAGTVASNVSLLYPTISLHAIQREPSPALYLQLSYELNLPELQQTAAEEQEDDFGEDIEPVSQLRFVPENESSLQEMYNALTTGQSLHPDPVLQQDDDFMDGEEDDDNAEEDDDFEDAEESSAEQAAARLQHMRLENYNGGTHDNGDVTENGPQ